MSHIQYLLTQHDCVIVPGWGAMIVQHTSALVEADNTLTPPRKWISFNPLLSHNDGILAHSVMRAMQCNYAQAMKFIEQAVASWRKILQTEKSVEWQGIGRFDLEQNNSIIFVESNESIVNVALTILKPIELPLLVDVLSLHSDEEFDNDVRAVENVEIEEPKTNIHWHRRVWQSVASVAAIFLLMLMVSTPIDNFEASSDYASLVATEILGYSLDTETVESYQEVICCDTVSLIPTAVIQEDRLSVGISEMPVVASDALVIEPQHPQYILVIGSLPSQSLAEKRIAEFKEMGVKSDIKICVSGSKYRLYVDGYSTLEQAESQLSLYNSQEHSPFQGVWICATQ